MTHFQVPDVKSFGALKYPLGNWPADADGFRLHVEGKGAPTGHAPVEKIGIEIGQTLTLQLTAGNGLRIETLEMVTERETPAAKVTHKIVVSPNIAKSSLQLFTIKGTASGTVLLSAFDTTNKAEAELFVSVGIFEHHTDMDVDLIASVMKSSDTLRIHALQRMLNNNFDNIFNQLAPSNTHQKTPSILTCGMVANDRGLQIFEKSVGVTNDWYLGVIHEPLTQKVRRDRSNLKYSPKKVAALAQKVGSALRNGHAVRLAVIDVPEMMNPRNGKLVGYYAGGHTVLVVGCNKTNNEFLYIDPYSGGSLLEYKGGFSGNRFAAPCKQLGMFIVEHDKTRSSDPKNMQPNIIRQKPSSYGSFSAANNNPLEVVAGPFAGF